MAAILDIRTDFSISDSPCLVQYEIASADPERGGTGGPRGSDPLKNNKNIGFRSNIGPPKNHKATKPAFNVGPSSTCQRNII